MTDWRLETNSMAIVSPTPPVISRMAPLLEEQKSASGELLHSVPAVSRMTPLPEEQNSVSEEPFDVSSRRSILHDFKTFPLMSPVRITVTHKYFGVKFGVSSREPGVYLEGAGTSQWQPIRANKGTLFLCVINTVLANLPFVDPLIARRETHFGIAVAPAKEITHGN